MESSSNLRVLARKVGFDPAYLEAFERKLFIQGPQTARRLTNFFVLLLLATVIATYGVLTDSVATVIGAMIVAPLMGPIMATAAAVVMGSTQRTLHSLALVAAGVVAVILFSAALTLIVPDVIISFADNGEISSRISPDLIALLTALAAGAAGAYITAHEEIADSMGGVAIADVRQWLEGSAYEIVGTTVNGRVVTATIDGTGDLPVLKQLADNLATTLGRPVVVRLRVIPSQSQVSGG